MAFEYGTGATGSDYADSGTGSESRDTDTDSGGASQGSGDMGDNLSPGDTADDFEQPDDSGGEPTPDPTGIAPRPDGGGSSSSGGGGGDSSPDVVVGGDSGGSSSADSGGSSGGDGGADASSGGGGGFEYGTGATGQSYGGEDSTIGSETDVSNEDLSRGAGGRASMQDPVTGTEGGAQDRSFDPTSTDTTGLEGESGRVGEQARQLEQQLVGQQISSQVDGLKMSGAEFTADDIAVRREGDRLVAELSGVGEERIDFMAQGQAEQSLENQLQREFDTNFADPVSVDDGEVDVSDTVQREATRQSIAEDTPFRESEISFEDGGASITDSGFERVQQERQQQAAQDIERQLGLERGEDFTLTRTRTTAGRSPGDDAPTQLQIEFTQQGQQSLQAREEQQEGDIFSGAVDTVERSPGIIGNSLARGLYGSGTGNTLRFDLPGEGSLVASGRADRAESGGEAFGGEGQVESGLRGASAAFQENVIDPAADFTGDAAASPTGAVRDAAYNPLGTATDIGANIFASAENPMDTAENIIEDGDFSQFTPYTVRDAETRRAEAEGVVEGAGEIANLPGWGVTAIEAGETGVSTAETALEDGAGAAAGDLAAAGAVTGAEFTAAAKANPSRVGGQVLGSAVGSGAILRGAGRVGPRTQRAASYGIQPGEELAITAGRRFVPTSVATKVPGVTKRQIIPESKGGSGDPLVDIDIDDTSSTAIESTDFRTDADTGGVSVTDRLSSSLDDFVGDDRGQVGGGGRQRTKQRQRQKQQQEPVIEIDVGNDPAVRARQRADEAQSSSLGSEAQSDIETRVRADSRLETAQRLETSTMQSAVQSPSVGLGSIVGAELRTSQFAGERAISEPTTELGIRSEPITGTRAEAGQESFADLRTETASEARAETRTETLTETRSETDADPLLEDDDELFGMGGGDVDTTSKTIEYGIATPEDVLSGDIDAV